MNRFIIILIAITFFSACGITPIFEQSLEFVDANWQDKEVMSMEINITEPNKKHDLNLFINHSTEFEYQNIYLNIKTIFPDGKEVVKLVPVDLADKRGTWNGKCNSKSCNLEVFLQQGFKFKEAGKYIISVEQYSREKNLSGINNIRLAIFHTESN